MTTAWSHGIYSRTAVRIQIGSHALSATHLEYISAARRVLKPNTNPLNPEPATQVKIPNPQTLP